MASLTKRKGYHLALVNLSEDTRKFLTASKFNSGPRFYKGYYPSSASVEMDIPVVGKVVTGKCLREEFYERTGAPVTDPPSAYTQYTWLLGKAAEIMVLDVWKNMGIFVTSNEKFHCTINDISISGEIDAVLQDLRDGQLYGAEIKSIYGYVGEKEVFGNSSTVGAPKLNNLMQTFLYAYTFRPGNGQRTELSYFKIYYISRGTAETADYTVRAVEFNGDWYPEVNGKLDQRISINSIVKRLQQLNKHLEAKALPPRDYSIKYDDDTINLRYHAGLISDSAYEKWKKGKSTTIANRPGDWNCNYCKFRSHCYKDSPPDIPGWDPAKLHLL